MSHTQTFLNQITVNIDKQQIAFIRNETKKIAYLGNIDFNELSKKQKNDVLKIFDKLSNNFKFLHDDMEKISKNESSFTKFFRTMRFPNDAEFSLWWDHIQLVDNLNNDLNEDNFNQLKVFLANFGSLKIDDQTLDNFWKEAISPNNFSILSQTVFGLGLYSIFSHLDLLIHRLLFNDIEPICLGWLFQKKLNPKHFQYRNGEFTKSTKHKAIWTNPSRSLLTLMATFAALKLTDEKLSSFHGLNFANYLLNYTDKKDNFIKKANEGLPISYTDFIWLLSDKAEKNDIRTGFSKEINEETINIMIDAKSSYRANNLVPLWVIYRLFQNDCENRPKNTAYMHGIYYDFWKLFANFYQNKSPNTLQNQWPIDLQESAQPLSG